jgi:hypothetical protein
MPFGSSPVCLSIDTLLTGLLGLLGAVYTYSLHRYRNEANKLLTEAMEMLELKQNRLDTAVRVAEDYGLFGVLTQRMLDGDGKRMDEAVELSALPVVADTSTAFPSASEWSAETAVELECLPPRNSKLVAEAEKNVGFSVEMEAGEFIDPSFGATEDQKKSLARTWNLVKEAAHAPGVKTSEVIEMQFMEINSLLDEMLGDMKTRNMP